MKFLIITNHSYMLWQFRRELITELLKKGEVVISSPFCGREDELARLGCRLIKTEVDRRGINPLTDLKLYKKYKKLIKAENPDTVITYSIKPNIYAGYACRKGGTTYFVNVQGLGTAFQKKLLSSLVTILYRTALKKAKAVFFENTGNLNEFITRKIIRKEQAVLLPGAGIDTDFFPLCPYPDENAGIRFLFVGRIMKEKGVDELFAVAKRLRAEYGDRVHFELAGFFEDEYAEQVKKLTDADIIDYKGFLEEIQPLYHSCHCVVLPSYHEGMSNVLLEGAASGRALITSDIPGCREAVLDGKSGFLCPAADKEALYTAVQRFIGLSTAEREEMGRVGREHMGDFEKSKVVSMTLNRILAE